MMSMTHGHTRKYYQVLRENPKLDWVAVSTANEEVKEIFLDKNSDIPCYDSDEAMLDAHPEIEAVVLASENSEHLRQMKLCAKRGIHILSMKIPTFDMDEYDEMIKLIEKNDVICQVELELHYNPVVRRMKEAIASGKLGKILSVKATNTTLSPVWAFPWQGVPEKSYGKRVQIREGDNRFRGGALCDHPHIFDMIRELLDSEFDSLYAALGPNIRPDIEEEDMLSVIGRMKNGVIFSARPVLVEHGGASARSRARLGGSSEAHGGQPDSLRRKGHADVRLLRSEHLPQRRSERPLHGQLHLLRRVGRTHRRVCRQHPSAQTAENQPLSSSRNGARDELGLREHSHGRHRPALI